MGISVTEGLCIFLLSLPTVSAFQSDLTDWQESQKSKTLTDFMKISVWEENIQQIRNPHIFVQQRLAQVQSDPEGI